MAKDVADKEVEKEAEQASTNGRARKRVGDYTPDKEIGELLDSIEGQEVEISKVDFDLRSGKKGPYILSIITLTDGRIFHTGGNVVTERLAAIVGFPTIDALADYLRTGQDLPRSGDFPVLAEFTEVKSTSNPGQRYWTVR